MLVITCLCFKTYLCFFKVYNSYLTSGTGSIDPVTTTLTLLSETCQLIIPDLRSAIVIANPLKRCVELILNPPQSACSRIVISATSENDYIHWIGFLLLFTNLKKKGIQNKIFIPRVVVPMSDLIQLKSKLRVFIPGLHYNSNNTRRRSSTQSISSSLKLRDSSTSQTQNTTSASNITNGISASTITTEDDKYYGFPRSQSFPFSEIDKWTLMTGHLTEEGIMNLYLDDGSFFQNIDIKKVLASRIRPVDDTLFEMSNVMYIKATGAVIEDKSNDRLHIVKGLNKNKSSEKLFNPKSQENHIFFQFQTQSDLEDWFTYLRSFSKKRFLCLSSGNMLKGVRMGRTINVRVVEGRVEATNVDDTINSQNPFCDAYVEIQFEGITWARTFVSKSKTPFWREDFVFGDFPVLGPTLKFVLKKRLSHKVSHVMDPTIGVVILTENELKNNGGQEKWYPIMRDNNLTKRTVGQIPMSLSIKIDYDETEILAPQYYKRLGELLTDLSNNVTSELSDMTGDINSMSDICLKILQTEDKTVEWFMKLMDVEFNRLREILQSHPLSPQLPEYKKNIDNTLFRGNSLLTKALERYMKLVGGQYLDRVVGEFTREIVEKQACLEIDPSRIVDQENVTAIVGSNQRKLRSYAEQLWKVIESSIEDIPKSFRLLFKKLRLELYDDLKQDESLVFNSISGFLFLRYICPALLNPKLFGLIRSHPSIDAQRSLTLITKILQCFANRVRFGLKEPWMIPMNEFIESREPDLIEFYRKLTLIEEEDSGESTKSITFKEAPVKSVMDDNLSNPYLLDKYENYARLVKLLNSVPEGQFKGYLEASGKKIAPITASPSTNSFEFPRNTSNDNLENISSFNPDRTILKEFMSECRNIETKTRDIISKLENVEILEQSELEDIISHTQLQFNPESGHILLQSTRISYETPEVYKRNRSKSTAVKTRLKQNNANKSFQNEEVKSISENESTANLIATPVIRGPAYRAEESDTSAEEKTKSKSIMSRWIKKKLS